MNRLKHIYDLRNQDEGIKFKSDFNSFELIRHLIDIKTNKGYIKIDIIRKGDDVFMSRRVYSLKKYIAEFEIVKIN